MLTWRGEHLCWQRSNAPTIQRSSSWQVLSQSPSCITNHIAGACIHRLVNSNSLNVGIHQQFAASFLSITVSYQQCIDDWLILDAH